MAFDRDDALRNAEKHAKAGRLDAALAEYERVLEQSPDDVKTLTSAADLYVRTNQPSRAGALFNRLADQLTSQGFLPRAEAFYKRALKIDPHNEHTLDRLAAIAIRSGILVEAKAHLIALARARQERGDSKGAAAAIFRVGTLDPSDYRARREAARAAAEAGNHDLGAGELQRIAGDLVSLNRVDEAMDLLRESLVLAPGASEVTALTDRLAALGHGDMAARLIEEAAARPDVDGALADRAFFARLQAGDRDGARGFARTPAAWLALAESFGQADESGEALLAADEGLALEPGSLRLGLLRARLLAAMGDLAGAEQQVEGLDRASDPGVGELQLDLWLQTGQVDRARARLEELHAQGGLSPDRRTALEAAVPRAQWPIADLLADHALAAGDPAGAADTIKQFVAGHPGHILALVRLAEVAVDAGLDAELTAAQDALCGAYLAAGQGAEARVLAEDLAARFPDERRYQDRLREARRLSGVQVGEPTEPAGVHAPGPLAPSVHEADTTHDPFRLSAAAIDLAGILGDDQSGAARDPDGSGPAPEVDLSAAIGELTPHAGPVPVQKGSSMPDRPDPSNLDDVFRDFRDEVSRQSALDQAEQHFKVAVTYRDMGMIDDALRELELAARAPRLRFEAAAMLARLLRDRGDVASAVEWFERAAEAPAPTPEAGRQLLYELGKALEESSETSRALAVYLEIQADAPDYLDVSARIDRLSRVQTES